MKINATLINLYHVCHRELWLHANGINMEHNSDIVYEGKLIGENTYTDRSRKYTELEIDGVKIDFYDAREKVIHEVKKSDKVEGAHIAQVKYYIYVLRRNGIEGVTGIIEYPKMRQRQIVELADEEIETIRSWEEDIEKIISSPNCPVLVKLPICKRCSYFDFCYSGEEEP